MDPVLPALELLIYPLGQMDATLARLTTPRRYSARTFGVRAVCGVLFS
jgi:hypothetical protein